MVFIDGREGVAGGGVGGRCYFRLRPYGNLEQKGARPGCPVAEGGLNFIFIYVVYEGVCVIS